MGNDGIQFVVTATIFLLLLLWLKRRFQSPSTLRENPRPVASASDDLDQIKARLDRVLASTANAPSQAVAAPFVPAPPPVAPPPRHAPSPSLGAVRTQAVLLKQHWPPRADALSHWGGVPSLPADMAWPGFTTPDGTARSLSFLFQVDCAAIPAEARLGLMPDSGLLLFFTDLSWGDYWEWQVIHLDADPATLAPAEPPATLPPIYPDRGFWCWPQRDEDWPCLLPRFSVEPTLVTGPDIPQSVIDNEDDDDGFKYWPGGIALPAALETIEGAIVDAGDNYGPKHPVDGLTRPFANFPHDWMAVRIAMGHIDDERSQRHLDRYVQRGDMTADEAATEISGLHDTTARWLARAYAEQPYAALAEADSNAVWQSIVDYRKTTLFALKRARNDAIMMTLGNNPDAMTVLSPDALATVDSLHHLASRYADGKIHCNTPDRMLSAPTLVQAEAIERVDEWLMLLELSADEGLGHIFAEGVYQYWIRPEDLAARRFDRVELTGEAY